MYVYVYMKHKIRRAVGIMIHMHAQGFKLFVGLCSTLNFFAFIFAQCTTHHELYLLSTNLNWRGEERRGRPTVRSDSLSFNLYIKTFSKPVVHGRH